MRSLCTFAAAFLMLGTAGTSLPAGSTTVRGEVIDVQCHVRDADNTGEEHLDCALSCARKGARMGILTGDGVYTITGEYAADNNRRLLAFVAKTVEATGEVTESNGVLTLKVSEMRAVR